MTTGPGADNRSVKALRVAHVGEHDPDSSIGPHKAVAGILQNLPKHGVEVELWRFVRDAPEVRWVEKDGIRVMELPSRRRLGSFLLGLPKQTREAIERRSSNVDLVHFHSVFIADNARAGGLLDVPYVISPRGGYNRSVLHGRNRLAKTLWMAWHERRYIRSARALHAVSVGEVPELERLIPAERIFYIPNGIERDILERPIQDPRGKDLLFLGRLAIRHKGIDLLLEGYAEFLRHSDDRSSRLILAGPDFRGDMRRIEEQVQALGLADRVSLPGGIFGDEKWDLMERAYGFVLTSRWEGMPFGLLEALAVGRPALVTPETNMGGLVDSYDAGFQVTGDPSAIAEGIEAMLALSEPQYVKMQHQARLLVEEQLTWEGIAGDLAARYSAIVEGNPAG